MVWQLDSTSWGTGGADVLLLATQSLHHVLFLSHLSIHGAGFVRI